MNGDSWPYSVTICFSLEVNLDWKMVSLVDQSLFVNPILLELESLKLNLGQRLQIHSNHFICDVCDANQKIFKKPRYVINPTSCCDKIPHSSRCTIQGI